MNDALFIGIDIGTQGTKTVLADLSGKTVAESFCPSELIRPDAFTVYEDPEKMLQSALYTVRDVIQKSGKDGKSVKAIGIDSQMAGIIGVDENFNAVTPYDSWLDSRCGKYTELIKSEAENEAVEHSGGQVAHTHASKILWWKNERPEAFEKIKKFVMPNGFVAGRLCGLKASDAFMDYTFLHFNAFSDNLNLKYNENLLKHFGINKDLFPKIVNPLYIAGTVQPEFAGLCNLGNDCKVIAGCGDTAASSLGAGIVKPGMAYDVAGTASVFACSTTVFAPDTGHKTLLFSRSVFEDMFLPLSYIGGGGLCLKWFSDITGKTLKELDGEICCDPPAETPVFIPHFSGRAYPLDNGVSGAFLELNANTSRADMYRSILESIAFEYKSYFEILLKSGCLTENTAVIGVGGGAKSPIFSKIKADVLGIDYIVPKSTDSAPAAMALLSAKATGYISEDLRDVFGVNYGNAEKYTPNHATAAHYRAKAKKYLSLLNRYSEYTKIQ